MNVNIVERSLIGKWQFKNTFEDYTQARHLYMNVNIVERSLMKVSSLKTHHEDTHWRDTL